jgi:hypothetical protein
MNLWNRLEQTGRYVYDLDESWHMFSANLKDDIAGIQFSKKDINGRFNLKEGVVEGKLEYKHFTE